MRLVDSRGAFRFSPARLSRRIGYEVKRLALYAKLHLRNVLSRESAVDAHSDTIVSLTTFGRRLRRSYIAIESIARGHSRPGKLVLYVDSAQYEQALADRRLSRLVARGLELRRGEAGLLGHKKYIHAVEGAEWGGAGLVIADDDLMYHKLWLRQLEAAAAVAPGRVVSHWTKIPQFSEDGDFAPYAQWLDATIPCQDRLYFMGGSGTLLPSELCAALAREGRAFRGVSLTADDIWLNWVAVRSDVGVVPAAARRLPLFTVPGTQGVRLASTNVVEGQNDRILRALFTREDLSGFRRSASASRE